MLSWRNRAVGLLSSLLIVLSIAYPFVIFAVGADVPPFTFVVAACVLLGLRAVVRPPRWIGTLRWPAAVAIAIIGGLALLDSTIAAKAYPVVVSGGFALLFGASLWRAPSLVERIAELHGDVLSPTARRYCRRVTMVWTLWLVMNTLIAAALALAGSVAAWALWTGFVFYLITGLLFAGEMVLRRLLQRKHTAA
jgi:uncharacterized membrane protein